MPYSTNLENMDILKFQSWGSEFSFMYALLAALLCFIQYCAVMDTVQMSLSLIVIHVL